MGSRKNNEKETKIRRMRIFTIILMSSFFRTVEDRGYGPFLSKGKVQKSESLCILVKKLSIYATGTTEGGSTKDLKKFLSELFNNLALMCAKNSDGKMDVSSFESKDEYSMLEMTRDLYDPITRHELFRVSIDDDLEPYIRWNGIESDGTGSGFKFLNDNHDLFMYGPQSFGFNNQIHDMVRAGLIPASFYTRYGGDAFLTEYAYCNLVSMACLLRSSVVSVVNGKTVVNVHVSMDTLMSPVLSEIVPSDNPNDVLVFGSCEFMGPMVHNMPVDVGFAKRYDLRGKCIVVVEDIDECSLPWVMRNVGRLFPTGHDDFIVAIHGLDYDFSNIILESFSENLAYVVEDIDDLIRLQKYGVMNTKNRMEMSRVMEMMRDSISLVEPKRQGLYLDVMERIESEWSRLT